MHSDRELVASVARGDMDALKELFVRHHEDVLNVVYPIVGKKGLAEDIVQEAFLALLEHAADYKGEGSFKGWLYRIAVNLALMELRRERRRQPTDTFDGVTAVGEAPDVLAERAESDALLKAAGGRLHKVVRDAQGSDDCLAIERGKYAVVGVSSKSGGARHTMLLMRVQD